jgi:hypothetical protein
MNSSYGACGNLCVFCTESQYHTIYVANVVWSSVFDPFFTVSAKQRKRYNNKDYKVGFGSCWDRWCFLGFESKR